MEFGESIPSGATTPSPVASVSSNPNLLWTEITGVMCNLTAPLKAAGIPIYAISTWSVPSRKRWLIVVDDELHRNTDYILIQKANVERAVKILTTDGWHFMMVP